MKDKTIRALLFGNSATIDESRWKRVNTFTFPKIDKDDVDREISYPAADGLVLYLIKCIEKLERQIVENEMSRWATKSNVEAGAKLPRKA